MFLILTRLEPWFDKIKLLTGLDLNDHVFDQSEQKKDT